MVFKIFKLIIASFNLTIVKIKIKTIFLYNFFNLVIYIKISKNIKTKSNCNIIYKLLKALYIYKQFFHF